AVTVASGGERERWAPRPGRRPDPLLHEPLVDQPTQVETDSVLVDPRRLGQGSDPQPARSLAGGRPDVRAPLARATCGIRTTLGVGRLCGHFHSIRGGNGHVPTRCSDRDAQRRGELKDPPAWQVPTAVAMSAGTASRGVEPRSLTGQVVPFRGTRR